MDVQSPNVHWTRMTAVGREKRAGRSSHGHRPDDRHSWCIYLPLPQLLEVPLNFSQCSYWSVASIKYLDLSFTTPSYFTDFRLPDISPQMPSAIGTFPLELHPSFSDSLCFVYTTPVSLLYWHLLTSSLKVFHQSSFPIPVIMKSSLE